MCCNEVGILRKCDKLYYVFLQNLQFLYQIDDLPINRVFFTKNIENIPNNKWINLRDWKTSNQICMCWQVATPNTWKQVFNINNIQDIKKKLQHINSKINYSGTSSSAWFTDQIFLYKNVMEWNKKTNNYIFLKDKDTQFRRLGRFKLDINNQNIKKNIQNGYYSDYHSLRPMSQYSHINCEIYNLL